MVRARLVRLHSRLGIAAVVAAMLALSVQTAWPLVLAHHEAEHEHPADEPHSSHCSTCQFLVQARTLDLPILVTFDATPLFAHKTVQLIPDAPAIAPLPRPASPRAPPAV